MKSRINTLKSKATKDVALWARLDVAPGDLHRHPTITPILIKALGSIQKVIDVLRTSADKNALEVVRLWDAGSGVEHKIIPFEGYCLAAKTTPKVMIGVIMQAVVEESNVSSELLVAAAHPDIIQKTIKLAKTTKGVDERKAILQNRGFLPAPKNQVFNNYGSVSQDNRKQIANVSVSQLETDADDISLAVDEYNVDRASRQKALPRADIIDITEEP